METNETIDQQRFLEDVLLPRFRDELNNQRTLLLASLETHTANLLQHTSKSWTSAIPFMSTPGISGALKRVENAWCPLHMESRATDEEENRATDEDPAGEVLGIPGIMSQPSSWTGVHEQPEFTSRASARPHEGKTGILHIEECIQHNLGISREASVNRNKHQGDNFNTNSSRWLFQFVHSNPFRIAVSLVICANAASNGIRTHVEVDLAFRDKLDEVEDLRGWEISEFIFTICFTIELIIRVVADGREFCRGELFFWNLFDVVLVSQADRKSVV